MAEAKPIHLIENVEAMYPRLDQTYRYDRNIPPRGKTVPCGPTEENAKFEMDFRMTKPQAEKLYKSMATAYKEAASSDWPSMPKATEVFEKDQEGMYIGSVQLKGQYKGKITEPPLHVDAKNKKLPPEFKLTHGSTINIGVVFVPYSMSSHGVSLRIKAVQVLSVAEKKQYSPFETQDGFSVEEDDASSVFEDVIDTAPVEADEIPSPKKVTKKKEVTAPSSGDDLEAIVGDLFDDEDDE